MGRNNRIVLMRRLVVFQDWKWWASPIFSSRRRPGRSRRQRQTESVDPVCALSVTVPASCCQAFDVGHVLYCVIQRTCCAVGRNKPFILNLRVELKLVLRKWGLEVEAAMSSDGIAQSVTARSVRRADSGPRTTSLMKGFVRKPVSSQSSEPSVPAAADGLTGGLRTGLKSDGNAILCTVWPEVKVETERLRYRQAHHRKRSLFLVEAASCFCQGIFDEVNKSLGRQPVD
ncbi:hypothetical protein N658DRAFT_351550 [Parathielavia hyrcaniae]|uniref:Uncharacterized protein n=1 Tax=Parathielavia hyrcaniae TaxID=113614 RepID=A0AAN6T2X9_9PEZI|nr:hypothetical protein N658DRAFT_351550 [Parathielavia hyrcaniae]